MVYNAEYKIPPKLKPDIDFVPGPNDKEQMGVFESLQADAEGYEELEDDFVSMLTSG